jgi:hypothetical protein
MPLPYPGTDVSRVEKGHFLFPPGFIFFCQASKPLSRIVRVASDKGQTIFWVRQGWSTNFYSKHRSEPLVFTQALMAK